ncbi:MAG: hypothetical protein U0587_13565 [Candidatus Binatia bacterium]
MRAALAERYHGARMRSGKLPPRMPPVAAAGLAIRMFILTPPSGG